MFLQNDIYYIENNGNIGLGTYFIKLNVTMFLMPFNADGLLIKRVLKVQKGMASYVLKYYIILNKGPWNK